MADYGTAGAAGSFLQGLNSVIIPTLAQRANFAMQKDFADISATKKEVQDTAESLDALGEWRPSDDPVQKVAHDWLYSSDWNSKPPPEIGIFLAKGRSIINAGKQGLATPPAGVTPEQHATARQFAPGTPDLAALQAQGQPSYQPAAPGTAPAVASAENLVASQATANREGVAPSQPLDIAQVAPGGAPAPEAAPAPAQVVPVSQPAPQAQEAPVPAAPQPPINVTMHDTPEQRAAARVRALREGGVTVNFGKRGITMTAPGLTFTEQQKKALVNATRAVLTGQVSPSEVQMRYDLDPNQVRMVKQAYASSNITQAMSAGLGITLPQIVNAVANEPGIGRENIPKEYADLVFGPEKTFANTSAAQQAELNFTGPKATARATAEANVAARYTPTEWQSAQTELGYQPGQPLTPAQTTATRLYLQDQKAKQAGAVAEATAQGRANVNPTPLQVTARTIGADLSTPDGAAAAQDQQRRDLRQQEVFQAKLKVKQTDANARLTMALKNQSKANAPLAPNVLTQYVNKDTGMVPPAQTSPRQLQGMDVAIVGPQGQQHIQTVIGAARSIEEYRKEFNTIFQTDDPIKNTIGAYGASWAARDSRLQSFAGRIAQIMQAISKESTARFSDKDAKRAEDLIQFNRYYVRRSQVNEVLDDLQTKLKLELNDMGLHGESVLGGVAQPGSPSRLPVQP